MNFASGNGISKTDTVMQTKSRRIFIKQTGMALGAMMLPISMFSLKKQYTMKDVSFFDVIIIGGSYAGLSAGMALGRAMKKVLIVDSGQPCNIHTPHSHNFLTQDGKSPKEIAGIGKEEVLKYETVHFHEGHAIKVNKVSDGFEICLLSGVIFSAKKLIFATGVKDIMPQLDGFSACWGKSIIHCPFCHGYEVKNQPTGILGNGDSGFEFAKMLSNWTQDLTLFTNGPAVFTNTQLKKLQYHHITIIEQPIAYFEHKEGYLEQIVFSDLTDHPLRVLYAKLPFVQQSVLPLALGCDLTAQGLIKVNEFQKTSVYGISACGDSANSLRSVSNAVASGTVAGAMTNKELTDDTF